MKTLHSPFILLHLRLQQIGNSFFLEKNEDEAPVIINNFKSNLQSSCSTLSLRGGNWMVARALDWLNSDIFFSKFGKVHPEAGIISKKRISVCIYIHWRRNYRYSLFSRGQQLGPGGTEVKLQYCRKTLLTAWNLILMVLKVETEFHPFKVGKMKLLGVICKYCKQSKECYKALWGSI